MPRPVSRRSAVAGSLAVLATVPTARHLAARQTMVSSPVAGTPKAGGWSFTDDRDLEVTAAAVPATIVAQTSAGAALADFGIQVTAVYGPFRDAEGKPDFQAGNLDLDSVAHLGGDGDTVEIDVESLVAQEPDLIVDMLVYENTFWYLQGDAAEQIAPLGIPTVGISMNSVSIVDSIARFEELAVSLGADISAPLVTDAKAVHAAAEDRLKATITGKPGLRMLVLSPVPDMAYICSPRYMTDLHYFVDLGLAVVDHDNDDFFHELSWEEIGRFPADVILLDPRGGVTSEAIAEFAPVWSTLPAVQAKQIGTWYAGAPYSYNRLAPIMDELSALLESSEIVTR